MAETTMPATATGNAADPIVGYLTLNQFARGEVILDRAWTADHEPHHLTLGAVRDLRTERDIWKQRALDLQAAADQLRRQLDAAEAQPADREQLLTLIAALTDPIPCRAEMAGGCAVHGYSPQEEGARCPHAEALELLDPSGEFGRVLARAEATRHFSPGYDGEKPDHHGPTETCAMPACVKSRQQHEAAPDIQDLTFEILADDAEANPLESAVTEALADIDADPAGLEPTPPTPWVGPEADD